MGKGPLAVLLFLGAGLERDKSATLWHACFPALRLILALRSHQRSPGLTAGFNRSGQPLQQRRFYVRRPTHVLAMGGPWLGHVRVRRLLLLPVCQPGLAPAHPG